MSLLEIESLVVRHGQLTAVNNVDLTLEAGAVVAVAGANGAGKSTLLRTIAGLHRPAAGRVVFDGEDLAGRSADARVRRGLAMVPEGRRLFPSMTVHENLLVGGTVGRHGDWNVERVVALFPWIGERLGQPAGQLSGGEQQAVAIGRALMSNPRVLLLDEVSLGLAPVVVRRIYAALPQLVGAGLSVLLVEQDVTTAMREAGYVLCLLEGRTALAGDPAGFSAAQVEAAYFGLQEATA